MKKFIALFTAMALLWGLCACTAAQPEEQGEESAQGPTWQEQYDLGVRYLSEGNYEEAILAFTAAIEIDPKQALAYVGRGDAYVLSGETEDHLLVAKADYEAAIKLDETIVEAYLGLADVYILQGDYEKALEILRQGLENTNGSQRIVSKINEMDGLVPQEGSLWVLTYRAAYGLDGCSIFYEFEYDEYGYVTRDFFTDNSFIETGSGVPTQEHLYEYLENSTIKPGSDRRACVCSYYVENSLNGEYELENTTTTTTSRGTPGNGYIAPSGVCVDPLISEYSRQKVKEAGRLSSGEYYALYAFDEYGNPTEISSYSSDGTLVGTAVLEWTCINPLPLP